MKRTLAAFVFGLLATASALQLAERGKPAEYTIVLSKGAEQPFASAAHELQAFLEEMTGVALPIADDEAPLPPKAILIGPSRHARALLGEAYHPEELGDDAYRMKAIQSHLVLLGNRRGAQYAVYDLLERFGGCQWYSSWCSKIPRHDRFTVPEGLDLLEKPAFMMREPFWYDMFNTMQAVRNRCNGNRMNLTAENGGKIAFGGGLFVHTFSRLVPPEEFFSTHPEYFSEINGVRMNGYYQLCLSNPEVKAIVTARLKKIIGESMAQDPSAKIFSLSQNDTRNPCACGECRKLLEQYGTQSGVLIWFVNQVAEEIEKEYPEALIETLAYQYTREPPATIRPRANVIPRLCTIECDFSKGIVDSKNEQTASFVKDIGGWASMTDKLFIWDYVTDFAHYITPFPNIRSLQKNIQLFRDNHVVALMSQGAYQGYHADFAELKGWLGAKLMWNPDADTAPYLNDFFSTEGYYGAAGPLVRQYFDELHALVDSPQVNLRISTPPTADWLTDEFLLHAADLFSQAEAAVRDDPVHLYNVRKASMTVNYARVERLPKEKISFAWNGSRMMPVEVSPLRAELTRELLARFDERLDGVARPIKICENRQRNLMQYQGWVDLIHGKSTSNVKVGKYAMGALPSMNGILASFVPDGAENLIDVETGGFSFALNMNAASSSVRASQDSNRIFEVVKGGGNEIAMQHSQRNHSFTTIRHTLSEDGSINALYTARCDAPNGLKNAVPSALFALNLGNERNISCRIGDGEWKEYTADGLFKSAVFSIKSDDLKRAGHLTVASPKTGRAATIHYPKESVEAILLSLYPGKGTASLLFREKKGLTYRQTVSSSYKVSFSREAPHAASLPFDATARHGIRVDATQIVMIREGEWCYLTEDADSTSGMAVNLTTNHHEWCLRSFMSELDFDKDCTYKVRLRAKVETLSQDGSAFVAGIYDATARRGVPSIKSVKLLAADVQPGYQWFEMGSFTPHPMNDQWFWAAPGVFNPEKGEKSPAKSILVDCLEFIPER